MSKYTIIALMMLPIMMALASRLQKEPEIVNTNEVLAFEGANNWDADNATNDSTPITNWIDAPVTYGAGITNTTSSAMCYSLSIGPVTIDHETGKVTIREGADLDETSLDFWRRVERAYPEMFADKIKKDTQQ